MSNAASSLLAASRDGFANIVRNLGWLLGGKGFAAIVSLVYIVILSRSLGVKGFGHFSLIFGTAQALVAVASFQTWQTMVRFGARYAVEKDWQRFGRLIWLCGTLDIGGAILGTALAAAIFYGFSGVLDLNPDFVDLGFWFSVALLWARMTTPNGIVRVLNRFDIGSYVEAIVPAGRLIAALVIAFAGASVERFLLAWALLDLLAAAVYWFACWRLAPEALNRSNWGDWRASVTENPGIAAFFGITYVTATLDALTKQGPLLAVGYFLGTSSAGIYRLADQLAQSIGKFAQIVARAIFPEFVHSHIGLDATEFRRLFARVTLIAASAGFAVTVVMILFGADLLDLVGGEAYARGAAVMVPLAIGASFQLASVAYEPMFYATAHPRYPLIVRAIGIAVTVAAILLFVSAGPVGVGWAVCLGMALAWALLSLFALVVLREAARREVEAPGAAQR
ncbi:oligosaccharide flippase family protein [Altererythrobacter salegens]|uniref:Oligosaccharide flippase family protein n=1 Tax=Croceibacterium salegens TaxID=1737568 RepID=A0A6I4SXG9_9SPHN|nr:oligosaccharide flippase family protein [Croceibacterium salegens]MXO59546.1 oligosaccharide flippase family protein [Croceibacterium salegens]